MRIRKSQTCAGGADYGSIRNPDLTFTLVSRSANHLHSRNLEARRREWRKAERWRSHWKDELTALTPSTALHMRWRSARVVLAVAAGLSWQIRHSGRELVMFIVLELKNAASARAREVGTRYPTREKALAGLKKHLKTFNVSGHNPEGDYWWARDSEGLRKCWISSIERQDA